MTESSWPSAPPKRILLATDLSASSDRALDRAVQLARRWNAALLVLHALETEPVTIPSPIYEDIPSWRRPPDPAIAVESQIRRDIREDVRDLGIVVAESDPVQLTLDMAQRERCDLVVLGAARERALGRVALGRTVEHLTRRAPVVGPGRKDAPVRPL